MKSPPQKTTISDSDDSDFDVKRVVKSVKDKQLDEAKSLSSSIKSAIKSNSWASVLPDFEKLIKVLPKIKKSEADHKTPIPIIRSFVLIEDSLEKYKDKSSIKELSTNDARSLNTLKQRIKKALKPEASGISAFRANPTHSDDEDNSLSKEPSFTDVSKSFQKSSSSSDEAEEARGISKWLKRDVSKQSDSASKLKSKKVSEESRVQRAQQKKAAKEQELDTADDGFTTVGRKSKPTSIYNSENLSTKLAEITSTRGRKGVDKQETINNLEKIYGVAANPLQQVKVLLVLIPAQFDSFVDNSGSFINKPWDRALELLNMLLSVLEKNPNISVQEDADTFNIPKKDTEYNGEPIKLMGSIIGFLERLCDDFTRNLVALDPHTTDYVDRMADDLQLYIVIVRVQRYLKNHNQLDSMSRAIMKRLEYLYYRPDQVVLTVENAMAKSIGETPATDVSAFIHLLCTHMYDHKSQMFRTRAMLMHIYNHALHKRYYVARDLLLMSHIQDTISQADIETQILFNRTLVQLGLSAFKLGMISESFGHLHEVISSGRVRELLGQGVGQLKYNQLTPEQEKLGRVYQLPFHMHINFELLECVYLIDSMLLEISSMAASINSIGDSNKRVISKVFRKMFDFNERQIFTGPPENTRDHIMAASKALATGDWQKSFAYIQQIKIWNLMPDNESVLELLFNEIKIQALKTYLFTYYTHYDSLSISNLAQMFELESRKVSSSLSSMIYNSEIDANLDEVANSIIFAKTSTGASLRLQQVTMQMTDKVSALVETNEKIYELKINGGKPIVGEKRNSQNSNKQKRQGQNRNNRRTQNRNQDK
ncbi:hypothetical protein BB560_006931 [Smittium megazygosporum]|uniref:Eukaryotic translation initiation factor 3 subunit C n=1 Tax=Smittium megazygosporum TaxID=133381 RepID=A0A2T9Y0B4_9FUNG|nr:hypothetical protein BB560_006931 [Smittium megazygosporum]